MKDIIKNIFKFLILGITTVSIFNYIESSYFVTYLKDNLLTIQLATLAINISIISLIISKVQELKQNRDYFDSRSIIVSLKESLVEQLIIIIIGMFVLSMYDAKRSEERR